MPDEAVAWLRELGAERVAHPGGTLLAHLGRVRELLAAWGARPALQQAGLCHAFYRTDGFATALLPVARRAELAAVIGAEAEAVVYFYASFDRAASYPVLGEGESAVRDRFTGLVHSPPRSCAGTSPSCPPPTSSISRGPTPPSGRRGAANCSPSSAGSGVC